MGGFASQQNNLPNLKWYPNLEFTFLGPTQTLVPPDGFHEGELLGTQEKQAQWNKTTEKVCFSQEESMQQLMTVPNVHQFSSFPGPKQKWMLSEFPTKSISWLKSRLFPSTFSLLSRGIRLHLFLLQLLRCWNSNADSTEGL